MKKIEKIAEGPGYSAATVGKLSDLKDFVLTLSPEIQIPGKVFVGQAVGATGTEVSFQVFASGTGMPFLHTHKTHEELYIFLEGSGEFRVDDTVIPIGEGSVVRVAPPCIRTLRNTGPGPMTMICIQCKVNSFDTYDTKDGQLLNQAVVW